MLASFNSRREKVLAKNVGKDDGPFSCPECGEEVVIKKGGKVVHHFAHHPGSDCFYGIGETMLHLRAKQALYDALLTNPRVTELDVEHSLGSVRADIFFRLGRYPVGIEVQRSALTSQVIARRTRAYAKIGVYVLWVVPFEQCRPEDGERYAPSEWEKYLHALYFGHVFYWTQADKVQAVHFDGYLIENEYREWCADGEVRSAGGHAYWSKRYRTPVFGRELPVTELAPSFRKEYAEGNIPLPAAYILTLPKPRTV